MSKKKKDPKGPQEINPLLGFEEFIQTHNIHIHQKVNPDKSDEGKIQSFLENNYKRLSKTTHLFQNQLSMVDKYDQSFRIFKEISKEVAEDKKELIEVLKQSDSLLNRSLQAIFNSHFSDLE